MQTLATREGEARFRLEYRGAIRLNELRGCLLKHKPYILHFAGHGNEQGEILLKDDTGSSIAVPADVLGEMLATLCNNLRCIILNACYTHQQAKLIAEYIDAVIVMSAQIEDRSAIVFVKGFYEALIDNRSLQTCFDSGLNEIKLNRFSGYESPQLICLRTDPTAFYLS